MTPSDLKKILHAFAHVDYIMFTRLSLVNNYQKDMNTLVLEKEFVINPNVKFSLICLTFAEESLKLSQAQKFGKGLMKNLSLEKTLEMLLIESPHFSAEDLIGALREG